MTLRRPRGMIVGIEVSHEVEKTGKDDCTTKSLVIALIGYVFLRDRRLFHQLSALRVGMRCQWPNLNTTNQNFLAAISDSRSNLPLTHLGLTTVRNGRLEIQIDLPRATASVLESLDHLH